jgi:tRNA (cytidine/uridine-2'-O-)-methyltransferase
LWSSLHQRINAGSLRAMEIALFEPDQPQNTGTMLRLAACMAVPAHVIEPCGFPFSSKAFRRSAMDYADLVELHHHRDWDSFNEARKSAGKRLILLTTKAPASYTEFDFTADDILLVGSESSGAPDHVHEAADARVTIPMAAGARSLNVALSMAMVLGEALRQTRSGTEGNG